MGMDFQPEVGLYNQEHFVQNGAMSPQTPYSPSQYNMNQQLSNHTPSRPTTQINARAAELKAQLLKERKARGGSATPPVSGPSSRQAALVDTSSSRSPKTPITATKDREQEVNDLISQYSETKPPANGSAKQNAPNVDNTPSNSSQVSKHPNCSAKSEKPSVGSAANALKPSTSGRSDTLIMANANQKRHDSNGSISEGEIFEDKDTPKKPAPSSEPRERQTISKPIIRGDDLSQTLSHRPLKPSYNRGPREESPPRREQPTIPRSYPQRSYDDRREDSHLRPERRQPEQKSELVPASEYYKRRSSRDEDYHKAEASSAQKQKPQNTPNNTTNLADILAQDEDLREWLEITGYHNAPYRNKILSRRRALAKLDAERKKILADIEADERGLPATPGPQAPASMLPPPIPNKAESHPEPTTAPMEIDTNESKRDKPPNKRTYSDIDDRRDGGSSRKVARTDDHSREPRVKEERSREDEDYDFRRPRSSGYGSDRRSSLGRREERGSDRHRYDNDRNSRGGRASSRDRDMDGRRAYDNRPPARPGTSDSDSYYRDDHQERRPFVQVGGYRGRAYDPNYKSRARGRGRGDFQSHMQHEERNLNESFFGNKLATSKPYRDSRGFNKGGKGDTRYFIVKSFNEDNVLKCIADSVWTTQLQNGPTFKEAFENSKNVILVFSINKSRAFQGYARMESLPGTVEIPKWQESINWESAGAFKVKWLVICSTRFHRIGHLKNAFNDNQAVLIGKDGQEIEENCGAGLIELIDDEAREALKNWRYEGDDEYRNDYR